MSQVSWFASSPLLLTLLACSAAPPRSAAVTFGGQPVHYTAVGDGPQAVVFVHGWACARTMWREQLADPLLRSGRTLLAIDLPGHGDSPAGEPLTMDVFADAIVAVLDASGHRQCVLVGHSNGTPVAMRVLARHPDRVAGLVAVDGPMRPFFARPEQAAPFLAPLQGAGWRDAAARIVDSMLPKSMPADRAEFIRTTMLATSQRGMSEGFAATLDPALWHQGPIDVPVLVVNAPNPAWTDDYDAFVTRLCPQLDYQRIGGVSHFLQLDAPAEFDRRLAAFLTRIAR